LLRTKLNFLFAKFSFGMDMKGFRNPSSQERQPKGLGNTRLIHI